MALTDVNSSAACLEFLRQSREFDVHPVVGIDFKVKAQTKYVALARTNDGFKEINKHLSQQLMYGEETLDEAPDFSHVYIIYPLSNAPNRILKSNEFVGVAPAELMRLRLSPWLTQKDKLVALQPMTFRSKYDFNTHRLLRSIDQNCLLSKLPTDQQTTEKDTFWSCEMLRDAFAEFPHIIQNTERLLQDCHVNFEFGNYEVSNNQHHFLVLYSMEADATISGRAHLQLMGWPVSFIERSGISDSECRDLAGNSFSCPISCLISCCMIMNRFGPWWSESEQ